jgi:hypothetical protein
MTELREVVAMRGRRLGQGRVGSIGMRLGPRGVGSTRGKPAPTHTAVRGNRSHGAWSCGREAGIGHMSGQARASVTWSR